jgi:hypothetical protein
MTLDEQIAEAVGRVDFGKPSAAKRGRRSEWPYVPVIDYGISHFPQTEQIRARAFATREEAVLDAEAMIAQRRAALAEKLGKRNLRALRESHGLPRELPR